MKFSGTALTCLVALAASALVHGHDAKTHRYIRGKADAKSQIVVVNEGSGGLSGYVAGNDGNYVAGPLEPGRYTIYENMPHHAKRHLDVSADHDGQVDL